MVFFISLSCLFLPIKYTESEFEVGECFSETYDTIASKENFSTGNHFLKLLNILLKWADINKNLEVLQTLHFTALVFPYRQTGQLAFRRKRKETQNSKTEMTSWKIPFYRLLLYCLFIVTTLCILNSNSDIRRERTVYFLGGNMHNIRMLWVFPQENKKTPTESPNKLKTPYLFPSSKVTCITGTSSTLNSHCSLLCVSSENEFPRSQRIWERSEKKTLPRQNSPEIQVIHCLWFLTALGTIPQNLFDWLI